MNNDLSYKNFTVIKRNSGKLALVHNSVKIIGKVKPFDDYKMKDVPQLVFHPNQTYTLKSKMIKKLSVKDYIDRLVTSLAIDISNWYTNMKISTAEALLIKINSTKANTPILVEESAILKNKKISNGIIISQTKNYYAYGDLQIYITKSPGERQYNLIISQVTIPGISKCKVEITGAMSYIKHVYIGNKFGQLKEYPIISDDKKGTIADFVAEYAETIIKYHPSYWDKNGQNTEPEAIKLNMIIPSLAVQLGIEHDRNEYVYYRWSTLGDKIVNQYIAELNRPNYIKGFMRSNKAMAMALSKLGILTEYQAYVMDDHMIGTIFETLIYMTTRSNQMEIVSLLMSALENIAIQYLIGVIK